MTGPGWAELTLPAALDELPTPALVVDVNRMQPNIDTMAQRYADAGIALRPHVKTSKCWSVAERQLAADAVGFTCSTPAEVAWLQGHGVDDLLWAHEPIGPRKVEFAVAAAARGGLTLALDSPEAAAPLAVAAEQAGVVVPFVLEINTGQGRTGVEPELALDRAAAMSSHHSLRLRGVLTHEGQLAGYTGDRDGLESAGRAVGALLVEVAGELREAGHAIDLVSVGSTPGAPSAPFAVGVTEARPGTYVYFDANQMRLGSCGLDECALTVVARVVSTQRPERVIIDAGIKAMSSDALGAVGSLGLVCDIDGVPLPDVTFFDGNEEHGFVSGAGAAALRVGDLVRIIPNHACGTTNMWSAVYAATGALVTERWAIAARY
jgi:D-serine deaminase-like pyridoxal phosphate-dependent protein